MTTPVAEAVRLHQDGLEAEDAGAGMWGALYRAPERRRYYRLIPNDELSADQRAQLGDWRRRPRRRGLAPVMPGEHGDQQEFDGRWFQVVTYETVATRSLADEIAGPDPLRRVAATAAALRALPDWWDGIGHGLLPLPADIVFDHGIPLLLPLPPWGVPSVAEVLAEPERIAHLSPEAARGTGPAGRGDDVHAMAIAVLRCLDTLPDEAPERSLHRAACAGTSAPGRCDSRLPLWMSRIDTVRALREETRLLSGHDPSRRDGADPAALADLLQRAHEVMSPLAALRSLREAGEARRAVDLAHVVLLDDPEYDVLLLAATIAHEDLRAPLEALSLLERAVQAQPVRAEAYTTQLSVIADRRDAILMRLAEAADGAFARRLDETARTAFDRLPVGERRDHAHKMAVHLIGRGAYAEANGFVHKWLHDDHGALMWWLPELMLDYAETYLRLELLDQAGQMAAVVKRGLARLKAGGQMPMSEIHRHGMRLAAFEVDLLAKSRGGGTAT